MDENIKQVTIDRVENGYLVRYKNDGAVDRIIFEKIKSLIKWMRGYFDE